MKAYRGGLATRKSSPDNTCSPMSENCLRIFRITRGSPRSLTGQVQCSQVIVIEELRGFPQLSPFHTYGKRIFKRKQLAIGTDLVVAVARNLSVLLHKSWVSGEVYQPSRRHIHCPG